uniref:Uncharacterized protein n=1 Tax=Arundo donax TaxID=35708 RepID=A0A0A9BKI4_ARUDO
MLKLKSEDLIGIFDDMLLNWKDFSESGRIWCLRDSTHWMF